MERFIGIDLGTTNSVVAFLEGQRPVVIPNTEGNRTTPSVVLYPGGDEVIVGELAKRQLVINPSSTISSIKRFIGRRPGEVAETAKQVQYHLVEDMENERLMIDLGWKKVSPEEVSAEILKKLRDYACSYLNTDITQAVITIPAYFNDSQRSATKAAAEMAGLEVIRIVNEPTAAALAYGQNKDKSEIVAVFDFGGGTFDISILELDGKLFEVRATNGDTYLGGDNIDNCILEFIREEIKKETKKDIMEDVKAVQRVREASEKIKCELSKLKSTTISLPFIISDEEGPKHFTREFTRDEFNKLAMPLFERLIPPCRAVLTDAGMTPASVDTVLLVGGSTRIPKVREIVSEFFGREPRKDINPDEVVAMGAAIQAGVATGYIREVLLLDVTPLSLGIEIADDVFSVLIPRNSNIPTDAVKKFTTVVDNQKNVFVHVLQGERKRASQNRSLAHFRLTGITTAPKDIPEIEVKFSIDANGIMNVSATDLTSGARKEVKIESYHPVKTEEVEREVKEAEEKHDEDKVYMDSVRKRDIARNIMDGVKKFIMENEIDIDPADMSAMQEVMVSLEGAFKVGDVAGMESCARALYGTAEKYQEKFFKYNVKPWK